MSMDNRVYKVEQKQRQIERTLQGVIKELQRIRTSSRPLSIPKVSTGQGKERSIVRRVLGKKILKIGETPPWIDSKKVKEKEREKEERRKEEKERRKEQERERQKREQERKRQRIQNFDKK